MNYDLLIVIKNGRIARVINNNSIEFFDQTEIIHYPQLNNAYTK